MARLKIALAQMRCEKRDWEGNLERAGACMKSARAQGCDVIILPEMGLSGYCDPTLSPDSVQTLGSPWIARFVQLADAHDVAASGGFIEANPGGKPFITQVLTQNGRITGVYRKIHVVDEEAEWFSAGSERPTFHIELPEGDIPCAMAICADSDRPDIFADFARQGARIVFHSSAPGLYGRRTDQASWQEGYDWYRSHIFERLPHYARANHIHIAVATQSGATVDEDFPGGSFVFSPDGKCLASAAGYGEELVVCKLDIA